MTKNEIVDFLRKKKPLLKEQFGVSKLGLFGSYAAGKATVSSDIDIAVEIKGEHKFRKFFGLKRFLEQEFHKKIDLGTESTLKPMFRQSIKKTIIYV